MDKKNFIKEMFDNRIFCYAVIVCACAIALLFPTEMTFESWGYWSFAHHIDKGFVILDRSPFYTLYLHLFSLFSYPVSYYVETCFSLLLVCFSMFHFLKIFASNKFSTLATIVWIPYFLVSEPYLQKLGLSFLLLALIAREASPDKWKYPLSYFLLSLAYMMRPVYIAPLVFVLIYDLYKSIKQKTSNTRYVNPRLVIIALPLILQVYFATHQSASTWNNPFFSSRQWFPGSNKLSDDSFIEHISWDYIPEKFGALKDNDYYLTHRKMFGNANTFLGCLMAQPGYVLKFFGQNIVRFILVLPTAKLSTKVAHLVVTVLSFALLCFGLYKVSRRSLRDFVIILCLLSSSLITILSYPKVQYLYTILPLAALSALYFIGLIRQKISNNVLRNIMCIIVVAFLYISPLRTWAVSSAYIVKNARSLTFLHDKNSPYVKSHKEFANVLDTCGCKGIMTQEYGYFTAFFDAKAKIYDVWEIPPFGNLSNSGYKGLNEGRVDCLLISNGLTTAVGQGTNVHLRYVNFILPYKQHLISEGASVTAIKDYGILVRAKRNKAQ